tara:strand:- start:4362 stop:4805 length:444 start_codon:yes stop_codon:yes gene_type:complete
MGLSLTTSNMFKENKINVNKTLVELESVDVGEGIQTWNWDTNETETTLVTEVNKYVAEESEVFYLRSGENVVSLTAFHKVPFFIDGEKQELPISEVDSDTEGLSVITITGINGCVVELQEDHTSGTDVVTIKTEAGYYFSNNILICD